MGSGRLEVSGISAKSQGSQSPTLSVYGRQGHSSIESDTYSKKVGQTVSCLRKKRRRVHEQTSGALGDRESDVTSESCALVKIKKELCIGWGTMPLFPQIHCPSYRQCIPHRTRDGYPPQSIVTPSGDIVASIGDLARRPQAHCLFPFREHR
jgi:hypothetical protein